MQLTQGLPFKRVFLLRQSADHITGIFGLTPQVSVSKNGASFAAADGVVSEIGGGFYMVDLTANDTDTLGPLSLLAYKDGPADRTFLVDEVVPAGAGPAADPLTSPVPGAYAAGTAGAALARLATGIISVRTNVVDSRLIEIIPGDDYMAVDGRDFLFTDGDSSWPDMTDASNFEMLVGLHGEPPAATFPATYVPGAPAAISVEAERAITETLVPGGYRYRVRFTLANGHVVSICHGGVRVTNDP